VVAIDTEFGRVVKNLRSVAGIAFRFGMRPEQRESRQIVVEKHVVLPGVHGVAIETLRPLRSLVGIILFVARQAIGRQSDIENRFDVAGLAFERFVRASQCIAGPDFMIEAGVFPGTAGMTGAAIVAEVTVVVVIFEVTTRARDVEFVRERVLGVTFATFQFAMPAVECELCVAGVVETGIGPARRRMTVVTFLATASFMDIVFGMAAVAGRFSIQKRLVLVASAALGGSMIANQWITRRVVVEFHVLPRGGRMAVATFRSHGFAVDVVRLMAAKALRLCLPVF